MARYDRYRDTVGYQGYGEIQADTGEVQAGYPKNTRQRRACSRIRPLDSPRARGRGSTAKRTTTILRAATTTSTIKRRCAIACSVFV